jgi:FkbM family methyltransferase
MNPAKTTKRFLKSLLNTLIGKFGFVIDKKMNYHLEDRIHASFVKRAGGVLHIGAHKGQEAKFYDRQSASVLWVEAIPEVYEILNKQIANFSNQKAILALLGDENLDSVQFHVSSNDSMSSSIYEFGSELGFENLSMTKTLYLPMVRLDSILSDVESAKFPYWVLDVQGNELNVLKGSGSLLDQCHSIYTEVSTREVYKGGVLFQELKNFLSDKGFIPLWDPLDASHENVIFTRIC